MAADLDDAFEPRHGLITLVPSVGSKLTLVINADPDQTVAVGGWESSARIGRPAAKWWRAPGDGSLELDLAIDTRLVGGPSMARRLEVLAAMGKKSKGREHPPGIIIVGGDLPLVDGKWVMQTLALGARTVLDGQHVRQHVSVGLEPHEPVSAIEPVRQGRTRSSLGAKRRRRVIRSVKGDTLRAISLRQLGTVSEWRSIREWNPALRKVDPDAPLRTGTKVVLR